MDKILYTYDRSQFYRYKEYLDIEGKKIISIGKFMQNPTEDLFDIDTDEEIIDISAAITYNDVFHFEHLFYKFPADTTYIVDSKHLDKFSYGLRNCFEKDENINVLLDEVIEIQGMDAEAERKKKLVTELKPEILHKILYTYDKSQFYLYKKNLHAKGKRIISISKFMQNQDEDLFVIDTDEEIVDISAAITYTDVFHFEYLYYKLPPETIYIVDAKHLDKLTYGLRNCFEKEDNINVLLDEIIEIQDIDAKPTSKKKLITDLSDQEMENFIDNFNSKLFGHEKFKDEFGRKIKDFRIFNKLGEHKVLSLFLMGDSGVGKTEVARVIHKSLNSRNTLAKINFGNYSSHDALNSLIGSPRGYMGSDESELFKRVVSSDIGLILIDEFEKASNSVFNYFLDVLENGKLVNSLAEEIDVNGFIIVFTSNISKEDFPKRISPELRSRFNYKGLFNLLQKEDKLKFVHYRINEIIGKYDKAYENKLPEALHRDLVNAIDVDNFKNMRDLNTEINAKFVGAISMRNNVEIEANLEDTNQS